LHGDGHRLFAEDWETGGEGFKGDGFVGFGDGDVDDEVGSFFESMAKALKGWDLEIELLG
jgi:hypothetical protein